MTGTPDSAQLLQTMADEREIARTILMYCRGSDRKDLDLMRQAYHDDAWDDHGPFKGHIDDYMVWAAKNHERFHQMMHHAGPPLIELRGDTAVAETYCLLFQHLKTVEPGMPGAKVTMGCRYVDKFERRACGWKISHRVVAYHWLRKEWVSEEFAPLPISGDFTVALRTRDDPVYTLWDMPKPKRATPAANAA